MDEESVENNVEEKVSDNKELLVHFIEKLEELSELWNSTNPLYMRKDKRVSALKQLLEIFIKIKSDATIDDVRKKINTLRSNYRKEKKKIEESKRSGIGVHEIYKPSSWVFYALQFLDTAEKPLKSQSSIVENETRLEVENTSESSCSNRNVNKNSGPGQSSIDSSHHRFRSETKRKNEDHMTKQNKLLNLACDYLSQNDSDLDTAKVWSKKLKSLPSEQKLFAEKAINDVLFEAQLGTLNKYSVRINEDHTSRDTPYTTPTPTHDTRFSESSPIEVLLYSDSDYTNETILSNVPSSDTFQFSVDHQSDNQSVSTFLSNFK